MRPGLRLGAKKEVASGLDESEGIKTTVTWKVFVRRWRARCPHCPIELLRARESHPNKTTMKTFFKTPARCYCLRLGLLLSFLLLPVSNLHALIFSTNCPDLNPSLPQPKRISSGCDRFGALAVLNVN